MKKDPIIYAWLSNVSLKKKLYFIVGVFLVATAGIALFAKFGMDNLSTLRAYVAGESIYTKQANEAVDSLREYALTNDEGRYHEFLNFLKSPQAYKNARLELEKSNPDLNTASKEFIEGGSHPRDTKGMAVMFRRFRRFKLMDKAITVWAEADRLVDELAKLGVETRNEISSGHSHLGQVVQEEDAHAQLLHRIDIIGKKIILLGNEFSLVMGEASHWAEKLLLRVMLLCVIIIGATGFLLINIIIGNVIIRTRNLIQSMVKASKGDFSVKSETMAKDEIGILASAFSEMTENLKSSQEKIQAQNEELNVNNEELKSTNEELESTNEELKQANEELESTTEELRLANDEAQKAKEQAEKKAEQLERFNKVAVGRELKMKELKEKIAELEEKLKA